MKRQTENIVVVLGRVLNETISMNITSSNSIDFLQHGVSQAASESQRANNLTATVQQTFNKTQDTQVAVDNHKNVIVGLSDAMKSFNGRLDSTRLLIEQQKIRKSATYNEIEAVEVSFHVVIILKY